MRLTRSINAGTMLDCVARIAVHRMNLARAHSLLEWVENQGNIRAWGRLSAAAVLERVRLSIRLSWMRADRVSVLLASFLRRMHNSWLFAVSAKGATVVGY